MRKHGIYLLRTSAAFAHTKRIEIKRSRTFETSDRRVYPATSKMIQDASAPMRIPTVTFFFLQRITSATIRHNYSESLITTQAFLIRK